MSLSAVTDMFPGASGHLDGRSAVQISRCATIFFTPSAVAEPVEHGVRCTRQIPPHHEFIHQEHGNR